jgi:hypothetical protein
MTRHRPHAVLLLFLLLIFATPAVGQEAGQRARGEIIPASIHFGLFPTLTVAGLFPTSTVEGLLTPDLLGETDLFGHQLLGLEMEDGTIIARDDLINPEYFASLRPDFMVTALGVGVAAVVGKFILDQIVGRAVEVGTCAALSTLLPGEEDCLGGGTGESPIPSYPVTFGLGAAVGASLWVIPSAWRFDWKPW